MQADRKLFRLNDAWSQARATEPRLSFPLNYTLIDGFPKFQQLVLSGSLIFQNFDNKCDRRIPSVCIVHTVPSRFTGPFASSPGLQGCSGVGTRGTGVPVPFFAVGTRSQTFLYQEIVEYAKIQK